MTDAELYLSRDHRVWAAEFCRIAAEQGFDPRDQDDIDWVASWIANAMMRGHDGATGFREIAAAMTANGFTIPPN